MKRAAGVVASSAVGLGTLATVSRLPWSALARRLSGRLVFPGDRGFSEYALPNNLRYSALRPAAIALCTNAHDVSAAILWARENDVALVARSGGHSYAGYSTTSGLMIDLRAMNAVSFNEDTGVATLGGGASNADFIEYFRNRNVAITHGRCPTVGIAGLTLGGGIGFNMRAHGLTCDQMISTQIVTADGVIRSLVGDDDLLWACRGAGGGNFGINTSFALQTFDVGPMTVFDLKWEREPERIFATLLTTLERAPTTLGAKITAAASNSSGIEIQLLGQFAGTPAELREILAEAYAIAAPTGILTREQYWRGQELLIEPGHAAYYQERSRFFNEAIDHRAVDLIFDWLRKYPNTAKSAAFKLFQTGGRVNDKKPGETAFVHRKSRWLGSIELYWNSDTHRDVVQKNLAWQSAFYDSIVSVAKGGAYQNFIDPSLTDWKIAYYGANLQRLEGIKRRVDPTGIFSFPEAIPPSQAV